MKSIVENFLPQFEKSDDCRLRSLVAVLRTEGIACKGSTLTLLSRSMRFNFFNSNSKGSYPVPILLGVDPHFFEKFISHSFLPLVHMYGFPEKDDFQYIASQIQAGHCVIITADRFDLLRLMVPSFQRFGNRHIPLHTLVVYGVDTDTHQLLLCETCSNFRKFFGFWVDADKIFPIRHSKCYDFEICGDMYSFSKDVATVKFIEFDKKQALLEQAKILCEDFSQSIPKLEEFCKQMKQVSYDETVMLRYYISLFKLLKITLCGMDPSGFFYRSTLDGLTTLLDSVAQREVVRQIQSEWYDLSRICRRMHGHPKDYENIILAWTKVTELGTQEYNLFKEFL